MKTLIINTDGCSKGNPGRAAIGATLKDEQNRLISFVSQDIGRTTNNQAEYRAVIAALEEAVKLGADQVELRSDSELLVKQLNGRYRVKTEHIIPLYKRVKDLQSRFKGFKIIHIPRSLNMEADMLANKALK